MRGELVHDEDPVVAAASARASATRRCSPPERRSARRVASPDRPTQVSHRCARSRARCPVKPRREKGQFDILLGAEVVDEGGVLTKVTDIGAAVGGGFVAVKRVNFEHRPPIPHRCPVGPVLRSGLGRWSCRCQTVLRGHGAVRVRTRRRDHEQRLCRGSESVW